MKIDGRFWLTKEGQSFLGFGRVELLTMIDKTGSINGAAKELKMSYKAAWERINQMNALSDEPLIQRTTGGKGGGGSKLTPYAHELIATFHRFDELHRQFIDRFSEAGSDPERLARILSRTFLTTSARNQLPARLIDIENQGLHTTLKLLLQGGETLYSTITTKSVEHMGLIIGCDLYAIIKSSDITISLTPEADTYNLFPGVITSMEILDNNLEVSFRLEGGTQLIALQKQDLYNQCEVSQPSFAYISPLHIIIGL